MIPVPYFYRVVATLWKSITNIRINSRLANTTIVKSYINLDFPYKQEGLSQTLCLYLQLNSTDTRLSAVLKYIKI